MWSTMRVAAFFFVLVAAPVESRVASTALSSANPIRKVVTMLESMQTKVTAEGEKQTEMFEKYMCYCKSSGGALSTSIADAETKIPELQAEIEEGEAQLAQLKEDITQHKADRDAAKTAMAEASAMREKEASEYAALAAEKKSNIDAIGRAVGALEKGVATGFLQTGAAQVLRKLVNSIQDMSNSDRQEVLSFLSGPAGEYVPQSGQITGILKTMGDEMSADLADATAAEDKAIKIFNELMAAKKKEVKALTKMIEEKMMRVGELGVRVAEMKNDLGDTAEALEEDKKFIADLEKNCATKEKEWAEVVKQRGLELAALADTIKILNDDDALELFKKTLPSASASFVQVEVTEATVRASALAAIRLAQKGSPRLDFIALALHGKKIGFEKVIGMIDEMSAALKQEQLDDDNKKKYCAAEFDQADDKKKGLERTVSDLETAIAETQESIATTTEEIKALENSIKALDKSVAEATEQRKEESEDFQSLMASDSAAKEVMKFAKNRLNKFYNPKLYKAPAKRELTEEERITLNNGGTLAPTNAPAGIAGTGITALAQVAPPPPPEAVPAYKAKGEESSGVIAMIDLLIADLDKEMTIAKATEKDAQGDYEDAMKDAAEKRAQDSKSLQDREAAKAALTADLQTYTDDKTSASNELGATNQYIADLHLECDWLLKYFDVRQEARASEVDALGKAKAVLSGADFSLLQTTRRTRSFLGRTKGCGPQTKLETTSAQDAAGSAQFVGADFLDGECKLVGSDKITAMKFCGPGTLVVSRMTCQSHDYKATTFEHSSADYTTNCETISLAGTVADGWLGSYSVSC